MRYKVELPDDLNEEEILGAKEVLEEAADLIRADHRWRSTHRSDGEGSSLKEKEQGRIMGRVKKR